MTVKHLWTPSEMGYIAKHYPDMRTDEIAKTLGLTVPQVYSKAKRMNIKKSQAFLDSAESGRTTGECGKSTRFKPGQTSWNKGKHYQAGGRSAETQFKPGGKPLNWKPIGTLRVNGDGYLDRKVNDLPGPNHIRWHPVHRLVWIESNGPLPEKHMVVFKPGMKTNVLEEITLDRLECISRADHARRHQPYSRGEEFGYLTRLKGAITRHVNRIVRNNKESA